MQPSGSHLVKNVFSESLPVVSHGRGVFLYDTAGRRYLDGCSGAVTANLGHGHPALLDAVREQVGRVTFAHRGAFTNEPAEQLADKLTELTGYPYVFLCGSGSEAVEAAMRFVLQYWRERGEPARSWFSSHLIGYHGATIGALSLSGNLVRRQVASALLYDFNHLTPPYAYRFAEGRDDGEFAEMLLERAAASLDSHKGVNAAVVVEPIGGAAGGAITPPAGYLPGLADLCRARDIPLVTDEVMSGLGRTGRLLAAQHWGVHADMVVLGKGMGAGYSPISAVLLSERMMAPLLSGSGTIANGHTYSGNPLSSAVALASLGVVQAEGLVQAAQTQGQRLRAGLEKLAGDCEIVGEVRGLGLLQGVELVTDRATRTPGTPIGSLTQRLVGAARGRGLLVYPANGGVNDAVLVAPPLTITDDETDLLLELFGAALNDVSRSVRIRATHHPY